MQRIERINFKEFLSGEYNEKQLKIKRIKEIKRKRMYQIVFVSGATIILISTGMNLLTPDAVFAADGFDGINEKANFLYRKLLLVGKWIIIVKGGINTINHMIQEDFGAAKRGFLTYLVVYLILHSLPWAMGEVDNLFNGINTQASGGQ
jgi:hypothetical protein